MQTWLLTGDSQGLTGESLETTIGPLAMSARVLRTTTIDPKRGARFTIYIIRNQKLASKYDACLYSLGAV